MIPTLRQWFAAGLLALVSTAGLAQTPPQAPAEGPAPAATDNNAERAKSQPYNNAPFWRAVRESGAEAGYTSLPGIENGVLIQDDVAIPVDNTRAGLGGDPSTPGPIHLQDHSDPVQFRNIWLLPLDDVQ